MSPGNLIEEKSHANCPLLLLLLPFCLLLLLLSIGPVVVVVVALAPPPVDPADRVDPVVPVAPVVVLVLVLILFCSCFVVLFLVLFIKNCRCRQVPVRHFLNYSSTLPPITLFQSDHPYHHQMLFKNKLLPTIEDGCW